MTKNQKAFFSMIFIIFFCLFCSPFMKKEYKTIGSWRIYYIEPSELELKISKKLKLQAHFGQLNYLYGDTILIKTYFINVSSDTINILPRTTVRLEDTNLKNYLPPIFLSIQDTVDLRQQVKLEPKDTFEVEYKIADYKDFFRLERSREVELVYQNYVYKIYDGIKDRYFEVGKFTTKPMRISFSR